MASGTLKISFHCFSRIPRLPMRVGLISLCLGRNERAFDQLSCCLLTTCYIKPPPPIAISLSSERQILEQSESESDKLCQRGDIISQ